MDVVAFTEDIIKSITKESDMVSVKSFGGDDGITMLEIIVHESDMGAVIGKGGKTAGAIRILVQAYAYLHDLGKININIDSF